MGTVRVQLPDGNVGEFPASMGQDQIQSVLAKQFPPPAPPPSTLDKVETGAKDLGVGVLKGAGSTANTIGHLVYPDWLARHLTGTEDPQKEKQVFAPVNTTQSVGKGIEQAGEFLLPGGLEEEGATKLASLMPKLGKFAVPVARAGTAALASAGVNTAQGGSPVTGALAGAGGSLLGSGLKAAAPTLTGIAQGLGSPYGKTGRAILSETKGVLPGSIRDSARGVLDKLNPELNAAADQSTARIPMASARGAASDEIQHALMQNQPKLTKGIQRMGNQLMTREFKPALGAAGPSAKLPIPDDVSAREYLELKRGVGKALPAGSWSPESSNAFKGPRNAIYGKMGDVFENAVPEAKPLNQRISALIPATEKPKNFFFGHALGPGVGATLGGVGGYRRGIGPEGTDIGGGLKEAAMGALGGAAAGYAAPAALNVLARTAWGPAMQRAIIPSARGALLQADRKKKEQ